MKQVIVSAWSFNQLIAVFLQKQFDTGQRRTCTHDGQLQRGHIFEFILKACLISQTIGLLHGWSVHKHASFKFCHNVFKYFVVAVVSSCSNNIGNHCILASFTQTNITNIIYGAPSCDKEFHYLHVVFTSGLHYKWRRTIQISAVWVSLDISHLSWWLFQIDTAGDQSFNHICISEVNCALRKMTLY